MQVADVCDDYLVGWAYWEFKNYKDLTTSASTGSEGFYNPDGSLQDYKVKALARSYMMLTQGVPTKQSFDMTTAAFLAEFTVNTDIAGESVLYTNKQYYYPNGFNFTVVSKETGAFLTADQVTVDLSDNRYVKFLIKDRSLQGKTVVVELAPF